MRIFSEDLILRFSREDLISRGKMEGGSEEEGEERGLRPPFRWVNPDGSEAQHAKTFRPLDEHDNLQDIVMEDLTPLGKDGNSGKIISKHVGGEKKNENHNVHASSSSFHQFAGIRGTSELTALLYGHSKTWLKGRRTGNLTFLDRFKTCKPRENYTRLKGQSKNWCLRGSHISGKTSGKGILLLHFCVFLLKILLFFFWPGGQLIRTLSFMNKTKCSNS